MNNRRKFSRVYFPRLGELITFTERIEVEIKNLSLNGAALFMKQPRNFCQQHGQLLFKLNDVDECLSIDVLMIRGSAHKYHLGVKFNRIKIDDLSSLRRLIEFNIGNEQQFNQDLVELYQMAY